MILQGRKVDVTLIFLVIKHLYVPVLSQISEAHLFTHIILSNQFNSTYISLFIYVFIYLFIKALQHKCWRSVGHQVLQPAKDVRDQPIMLA